LLHESCVKRRSRVLTILLNIQRNTKHNCLSVLFNGAISIYITQRQMMPIRVAAGSSPAQTLGSWIRIRLKGCMSVCVRQRPCDGLISRPRSPTDCLRLINWSETSVLRMPYASRGSNRRRRIKW
jgi:hypothetical protein